MIVIEILYKVLADIFAQSFFYESKVLLKVALSVSHFQELVKAPYDIILKPLIVQYRQDRIIVR